MTLRQTTVSGAEMTLIAQSIGAGEWGLGADLLPIQPNVFYVLVGMLTALIVGSVCRLVAIRGTEAAVAAQRLSSLRTWWGIAITFSVAVLLGRIGVVMLFGVVSLFAIREYMALVPLPYDRFGLTVWAYVLLLCNYAAIARGWVNAFLVLVPLGGLLVIACQMVIRDRADQYQRTAASLYWGMCLTIYCISHAALLMTLPASSNPVAGPAGWLLFLIFLTELNDIFQALIGRRIGKRAIAPVLSPHKTWEGLLGGIAATIILALVMAPWLTPLTNAQLNLGFLRIRLPYLPVCLAGLIISVAGYFGDLNTSGIKRDTGVKDSGQLLPGQGGLLDRIDSLTFTAPLFYYFVRYLIALSPD